MKRARVLLPLSAVALLAVLGIAGIAAPTAVAASPQVLRVGSWHGIAGNAATIEDAVAQLQPGGWLLIGPGVYHPQMDKQPAQLTSDAPAAMLISTPSVHVRGMNRNTVVIDGTLPGSPTCSRDAAAQDFGALGTNGAPRGRNGVEAIADGVYFENFTVCNFLKGSAGSGNEIWWNGGDDGGHIGLHSWWGNYVSATSTYYAGPDTAASYGIFVSNSDGPGSMDQTYASNFSDSGYYVGACPDCNAVINHAHSQYNALGYSGTNSGGHLVIENSEWDHNKTGFVSNSQNSADPPSPQDGACPNNGTGPTGTHSCWIFENNYVHDNNNPNVPATGDAAIGPVGAGVVLAGDRNNTVINNRFANNGSWALLTSLFPDTGNENPNNVKNCNGGVLGGTFLGTTVPCLFDDWGNQVKHNTFSNDGFFGNVTNGDIADLSVVPAEKLGAPGNCFFGNRKANGAPAKTWPLTLQVLQTNCNNPLGYPDAASTAVLGAQVLCATQALFNCPSNVVANYPRTTQVVMPALPGQQTMPNACAGVPQNPWCPLNPLSPSAPQAAGGPHDAPAARIPAAVRAAE